MLDKHFAPWTHEAVGALKRLAKKGLSARAIASQLGRTELSIRTRAAKEGVQIKARLRKGQTVVRPSR